MKGTTEHRQEASHRSGPEAGAGGDQNAPRATGSTSARKRTSLPNLEMWLTMQ